MTGRDDKHDALEFLLHAAEDLVSSDPDMPSHKESERVYELAVEKARKALSAPSSIEPKTANPERRSSLEHSEVKPDENDERRSGEVDREGSGSAGSARSDAMVAGCIERGSREAGRESDGEGRVTGEGPSAPVSAIEATADVGCPACHYPMIVEPGSIGWHRLHTQRELWIVGVAEELDAMRRGAAVTYPNPASDPLHMLKRTLVTRENLTRGLEIHEDAVRRSDDGAEKP